MFGSGKQYFQARLVSEQRFFWLLGALLVISVPLWLLVWLVWREVNFKWATTYFIMASVVTTIFWAEGRNQTPSADLDDLIRILVDKIEAIGILLTATIFIVDPNDRLKQSDLDIVNSATGRPVGIQESLERLAKKDVSLEGLDLSSAYLNGINLEGAELAGANFNDAHLEKAIFTRSELGSAYFINAKLSGARFTGAWLNDANFREAKLSKTNFSRADLIGASFIGANLEGAQLDRRQGDISHGLTLMNEAILKEVDFRGANLSRVDFSGADLSGANFTGADLSAIRWNEATLWDKAIGLNAAVNVPLALRQQVTSNPASDE